MSSNPGNGLYSNASSTRVSRSRFQDNGGAGAILSGSDSQIRDSISARNGEEGLILGGGDCKSCELTGTFSVVNVLIADNLVGVSAEADASDEVSLQMFNSIVTDNAGTGLRIVGPVKLTRLDHDTFNSGSWVAVTYRGEGYTGDELGEGRIPIPNDQGETYASVPEFLEPGDYHLAPDSPGVNEGTQEGVVSEVDIDGNPRVAGGEIDQGPYEQ
jgi:hypothetical protein